MIMFVDDNIFLHISPHRTTTVAVDSCLKRSFAIFQTGSQPHILTVGRLVHHNFTI